MIARCSISDRLAPTIATDQSLEGLSILLVDDDESIRDTFGLFLEYGGFETIVAASANEALRLINSRRFDVLVSDLHLPEAGAGWTIVNAMRDANPRAVTIIFSANPTMKEAEPAILAQTDTVLVKPASGKKLMDTIWQCLRQKSTTRES